MADLTDLQAAGTTKVVGADSTGLETTPVNATPAGGLHTSLRDSLGNEITSTSVGAKRPLDVNVTGGTADKTSSGTLAALNAALSANSEGCAACVFQVIGTWVGSLAFEVSVDGTNWITARAFNYLSGLELQAVTTNVTAVVLCAGFKQARVRMAAYTSGSAAVAADSAVGLQSFIANAMANNNATAPEQSLLVGGSDGSQIRPLKVDNQGRLVTSAITGFGADFTFGDVATAAVTQAPVRRTTYVEQTTNAQRSIVSSSALDTAAGTGARSVRITFLDQNGTGPFTETVTLNGTTPVNTSNSNICFIESMEVVTVGSTGVNAGIISLRAASGGGGATIGTINAQNNQTFWAHHYVPQGKECNVTGVSCGHTGTTVGSGGLFILKSKRIAVVDAVEVQVTDFVRLYGQSSTFSRSYASPVKITGPARIIAYVTPETATATTYRAAIDFFEP